MSGYDDNLNQFISSCDISSTLWSTTLQAVMLDDLFFSLHFCYLLIAFLTRWWIAAFWDFRNQFMLDSTWELKKKLNSFFFLLSGKWNLLIWGLVFCLRILGNKNKNHLQYFSQVPSPQWLATMDLLSVWLYILCHLMRLSSHLYYLGLVCTLHHLTLSSYLYW